LNGEEKQPKGKERFKEVVHTARITRASSDPMNWNIPVHVLSSNLCGESFVLVGEVDMNTIDDLLPSDPASRSSLLFV
jgi:hypothetical protein